MSKAPKDRPLERYMAILETVAPFADGLTSAELEAALNLPKTSVNRLLHGLVGSGMISATNARQRSYRLGERILRLLERSSDTSWLDTLAHRPLQSLAEMTGQSAFLAKFDDIEVRSVTCVAPDAPVRTFVMPGMPMPVNAAASAKAIMAFQPAEVLACMLQRELVAYTDRTKVDLEALLDELAAIRTRGYATDLAEHVAGLGSIAFPIRISGAPVIFAVGLTGPYARVIETGFEDNCRAIAETAQRLAKLLQLRLPSDASTNQADWE